MENFDYHRRTFLLFGRDRENEVGALVKYEGGRRVLCVYDTEIYRRSSLPERISRSLDRAGLECFECTSVSTEPTLKQVRTLIDECRNKKIDFILAVGGSTVIDCSKAAAAGAVYAGDVLDFFTGKREPVKTLGTGSIVIGPDTGAETSASCELITETDNMRRILLKSSYTFMPRFAVLNPELSFSLSSDDIVCSCMDMLVHIAGCYFTNTGAVTLTDEICEGMIRSIVQLLPAAIKDPADYDVRANLMLCSTLAQSGLCAMGRESDSACIFLEHELSALYSCSRGEVLAVLLPAWMTFCIKKDVMRFAQFAVRIFGIDLCFENPERTALDGIEALRTFLRSVGMPLSFEEMGLGNIDIHAVTANMNFAEGETVGNFVKLTAEDCQIIYSLAATYRRDVF